MSTRIDAILADVLSKEKGYVNDPKDAGGETNWGITVAVARAFGYTGAMKDLPKEVALAILRKKYVQEPGFDQVLPLSERIAAELVDTAVNMGQVIAGQFLQRALNAFNEGNARYPKLGEDGVIGPNTIGALQAFLKWRAKDDGELVMLRALNVLQGARYLDIVRTNPIQQRFVFGWLKNRVTL